SQRRPARCGWSDARLWCFVGCAFATTVAIGAAVDATVATVGRATVAAVGTTIGPTISAAIAFVGGEPDRIGR
ncbi:MAG: hypothetical protein M3337_07275, partial [Actinomycetota bacterium]|nr:hypothetical protein [Actinomycetota bacterium]